MWKFIADCCLPDSDDPVKILRWRMSISGIVMAMLAFSIWAYSVGFVKAEDLREQTTNLEQKLVEQTTALRRDIETVERRFARLESTVSELMELQLAAGIRSLMIERCKLSQNGRYAINNAIQDYQRRYREITGETIRQTPC